MFTRLHYKNGASSLCCAMDACNGTAVYRQQRGPLYTPRHQRRPRQLDVTRSYRAKDEPIVSTKWLAQHLHEVTVLDVRGHVDTELVEPGVEKSTYIADYDAYLEGHIPVSKGDPFQSDPCCSAVRSNKS